MKGTPFRRGLRGAKPAVLHLLNAATGRVRRLSAGRGAHLTPSWSPDGRFIAFSDGSGEINVVRGAGGASRQLTHNAIPDISPAWSPDGKRLAFLEQERQGNTTVVRTDVMSMNSDGSGLRKLTTAPLPSLTLSWSHDSAWVVFTAGAVGTSDLMAININTGVRKQLTHDGSSRNGVFSRDGRQIAFVRGVANHYQLAIMEADGSGVHVVRSTRTPLRQPAWSPNGRWLVVVAGSGTASHLELVSSDGSQHRLLTPSTTGSDESPSWSPDGARIAYVRHNLRTPPNSGFIATIRAAGTGLRLYSHARLTDRAAVVPQWKP